MSELKKLELIMSIFDLGFVLTPVYEKMVCIKILAVHE